jgi:hypothetical protein
VDGVFLSQVCFLATDGLHILSKVDAIHSKGLLEPSVLDVIGCLRVLSVAFLCVLAKVDTTYACGFLKSSILDTIGFSHKLLVASLHVLAHVCTRDAYIFWESSTPDARVFLWPYASKLAVQSIRGGCLAW